MNSQVATLEPALVWRAVLVLAAVLVSTGGLILGARAWLSPRDSTTSVVRSWLAIALVSGLMLFSVLSLGLADDTLRSTLFGGLIASTGAATAFYFASKNADQARQDILAASFGTTVVPDLRGKSVVDARSEMGAVALELRTDPVDADGGWPITGQQPDAHTEVRRGSVVVVEAPPPDTEKPADADTKN
jgi:hypothetical protein